MTTPKESQVKRAPLDKKSQFHNDRLTGRLTHANLEWIERQASILPPFPRLLIYILIYQIRILRASRHAQRN